MDHRRTNAADDTKTSGGRSGLTWSIGIICTQTLVITFNFLFCVTSAVLLLVGFWVLLDPTGRQLLLLLSSEAQGRHILLTVAYTLFLLGSVLMLLVFVGCCSLTSRPILINLYLFVVSGLLAVELLAVLVTLSFPSTLSDGLQRRLTDGVLNDYGHQDSSDVNAHGNNVFTQALDYAQFTLQCCGVTGPQEYSQSRWQNSSQLSKEPRLVPITCCTRPPDHENNAGSPISVVSRVFHGTNEESWQNPYVQGENDCQADREGARHRQGCLNPILDWLDFHSLALVLLILIPMALQILCIVFHVTLLRGRRYPKLQATAGDSSAGG